MTSLLARLLMLVVVALAPALAFQAYNEIEARHARQQLMEDEALRLLHIVGSVQQRIVDGAEQLLNAVTSAPAVQDNAPEQCQRLLANLLRQSPRYNYVSVLGVDGAPLCTPRASKFNFNGSDRLYFRLAMQTEGFAVGEYEIGRVSMEPTIHLAKPFRNKDGVIAGVVQVSLSLKWLAEQLKNLDLPPGTAATVVDRNGTILGRSPGDMHFVGQTLPAPDHGLLEGNKIRIFPSMQSLDGERRVIVAFSPPGASATGLGFGIALNRDALFAGVTEANRTELLLIIAGVVLALLLTASVGTHLIRRPVDRLLAVAEHWRGGDLGARTGWPEDRSEFGRLATAFENMAATLEIRERALHAALESTTDVVVVVDREWRLRYLNSLGRQRAGGIDPVGQSFWDAYPAVVGTPFEQGYRSAMESGVATKVEAYYPRLDGYFEANAFPSVDGLTIFVRDLTEERRVAAALRESESRLQLAREAAGFGVWDWDIAAGSAIWSEANWQLYGREPQPTSPDFATWCSWLHPDDRERVVSEQGAALADAERRLAGEFRVVWPDGSVHWLVTKATVLRGPGGEAIRVVGLSMDVTVSRETEAALRRLSFELEARVQEEVAAREAAQVRAAQAERMQALGQLAGGIAHDINNVLQAVAGALALIQRRPDDVAAVRRFSRIGTDAIERGASVTRRLLTFGRRGDLRAETVDVPALLSGLQEILSYTLGTGIEVRVTLRGDLPKLVADKGQLETVLVNLATNARDAMPRGGQVVFSAARETVISESHPAGLRPGNYVRLMVADTGTGMDAATLGRAGEPFFTTKSPGAGSGLGLPMAHGFAEQSGGGLTIESRPGQGTTVSVWLPQAASAVEEDQAQSKHEAPSHQAAARVLLVDDEDMIREVLAKHLEDAGYRVVTASNGEEALALLGSGEVLDMLVTDLSMPGMDGVSVIRAVQERCPGVQAVLLTGYAADAASLALSSSFSGAVSLLRKPVSDLALLDRIGAMLATRPALAG